MKNSYRWPKEDEFNESCKTFKQGVGTLGQGWQSVEGWTISHCNFSQTNHALDILMLGLYGKGFAVICIFGNENSPRLKTHIIQHVKGAIKTRQKSYSKSTYTTWSGWMVFSNRSRRIEKNCQPYITRCRMQNCRLQKRRRISWKSSKSLNQEYQTAHANANKPCVEANWNDNQLNWLES